MYIYGIYSDELYEKSCLSLFFSDAESPAQITKAQRAEVDRCSRMVSDVMRRKFGEDADLVTKLFQNVRLIRIDDSLYLSGVTSEVLSLSEKYGIRWEDPLWQR